MKRSIVLVGCGSIGLPLAAAFAARGHDVLGYDTDAGRMANLTAGTEMLTEDDLAAAIQGGLGSGALRFSAHLPAAPHTRCYIIAVPTPWLDQSGFDRRPLDAAFDASIAAGRPGDLVCIRSTVPVGTTRGLARRAAGTGIDVVSTPDRSIEGRSYREQFEVPHLIGALDAAALGKAVALFSELGETVPCEWPEESETAKLLCNVTRDVMFGLANEVGRICDGLGVDGYAVRAAAAKGYPRFSLARPGPVGGPCLAKDTNLLLTSAGAPGSTLIRSARDANFGMARDVADAVITCVAGSRSPRVAILGVAFKGKPPVADMRGSIALEIASLLRTQLAGMDIVAWDAEVPASAIASEALSPGADPYAAAAEAAAVIIANDHAALATLDLDRLALAAHPRALIYDLCGVTAGRAVSLRPGQVLRVYGGHRRLGDPAAAIA